MYFYLFKLLEVFKMNSVIKSSALVIAFCSFSSIGMCMDPPVADPIAGNSVHLKELNSKTKDFFETREAKSTPRRKGLRDAILLVEHREKRGNLNTLPYEFLKNQIQHVTEYANKNFNPFKKNLLQSILSDLNLSEGLDVDRTLYNCTAARLMALSALTLSAEQMMPKEEIPAFCQKVLQTAGSHFGSVSQFTNGFEHPWDNTDREGQGLFNVLVNLNLEEMKKYELAPFHYFFINAFSPSGDVVVMLDEKPFIGTQTISYGLLNDLHFLGGSLTPEVSAHNLREYKGSFGILHHDKDHYGLWKSYISNLEKCSLKLPVMNIFEEIYSVVLKEKKVKTQAALFDFLFVLMHEDSPIRNFPQTFKDKIATKQDIFNEFATYQLPSGPVFRDLEKLIATHGYDARLDPSNCLLSETALEKYRTDMLQLLKERGVY